METRLLQRLVSAIALKTKVETSVKENASRNKSSFVTYVLIIVLYLFFYHPTAGYGQSNLRELYCIDAGSGAPIIFLPGWASSSGFCEKQASLLSNCIVLFAMSQKVRALMVRLNNCKI
jgi:hypothetical protein